MFLANEASRAIKELVGDMQGNKDNTAEGGNLEEDSADLDLAQLPLGIFKLL